MHVRIRLRGGGEQKASGSVFLPSGCISNYPDASCAFEAVLPLCFALRQRMWSACPTSSIISMDDILNSILMWPTLFYWCFSQPTITLRLKNLFKRRFYAFIHNLLFRRVCLKSTGMHPFRRPIMYISNALIYKWTSRQKKAACIP